MFSFCKFHGFGNDYIVFEAGALKGVSDLGEFTRAVCNRNTGVGGDGIAVLGESHEADFSCRIINPDGSEAAFSGNGTRCAVAYLYYKNLWSAPNLKLETKSGIKNYELLERAEQTFWFRAELGKPKFDLPQTSLSASLFGANKTQGVDGFALVLPDEETILNFTFVDVGNPVAVVFTEDFDSIDWRRLGARVENFTELFPDRTNVVFVKIADAENVEIRIHERGAGETASSGTCSIAAAVASAFTNRTNRRVSVHAAGGTTEAVWRASDDKMLITGRADLAFCGEID